MPTNNFDSPLFLPQCIQFNRKIQPRWQCGGAILNEQTVLSSATCLHHKTRHDFHVIAGVTDTNLLKKESFTDFQPVMPSEIFIHPMFGVTEGLFEGGSETIHFPYCFLCVSKKLFCRLSVDFPCTFCDHSLSILRPFCVCTLMTEEYQQNCFCRLSVDFPCPFCVHSVSILCPFFVHSVAAEEY